MVATRPSLAPAAQLLLLTAAIRSRDGAIGRLLRDGVDREELVVLAEQERAAPIVLRCLEAVRPPASDADCGALRRLATVSVMRLLHLELLLLRTIDALAERNIEVLLLKGAALAFTAYASFADRPMGDLDILVRPQHAQQAWAEMSARGWTWPSAQWPAGSYMGHQHLPPLLHEPGGFRLEIHTDILPAGHPFDLSAEALWARVQPVHVGGRLLTVPHPVHQLWHVCVHFAWSHLMQWGAWRALRDCAMIVQQDLVDWEAFADLARRSRATTCCYWTLRLAGRLADVAVPEPVLRALRPPRSEFVLQRLERHYVSSLFPSRDRCPSIWLTRRLWEAGVLPGWCGHGRARPWDVERRWLQGLGPEGPEARRPPARRARLGNAAAGLAYLGRIGRFALPGHSEPQTRDDA